METVIAELISSEMELTKQVEELQEATKMQKDKWEMKKQRYCDALAQYESLIREQNAVLKRNAKTIRQLQAQTTPTGATEDSSASIGSALKQSDSATSTPLSSDDEDDIPSFLQVAGSHHSYCGDSKQPSSPLVELRKVVSERALAVNNQSSEVNSNKKKRPGTLARPPSMLPSSLTKVLQSEVGALAWQHQKMVESSYGKGEASAEIYVSEYSYEL